MSLPKIKISSETSQADVNIAKMLDMPGGLEKIALEKLPPFIREMRDYEAFGRKVLLTHNINSEQVVLIGGEPYMYYPKDFNSHAAFFADDGEIPRYQIEGDGVNVGIMTIASDDTVIHLKRLMVQKYNYLERVRELSGQAVAKIEDGKILDLINRLLMGNGGLGTTVNTGVITNPPQHTSQIVLSTSTTLAKADLVALKKTLSQWNVPLSTFAMHQSRLDDILLWATAEIDQLTQREMLESGVRYNIWGHKIETSMIIPVDEVYAFAEPEYVGRMPILKDLTVRLTERDNKLEKGLFMFEFLGMYLASQKAVGKLVVNYVKGVTTATASITLSDDAIGAMARDVSTPTVGYGSLQSL